MIRLIYLAVPVICLLDSFFAKPKDEKAELTASEILALVDFDAGGKTYKQKGFIRPHVISLKRARFDCEWRQDRIDFTFRDEKAINAGFAAKYSVLRPSGRIVESTNCYLDAAVNAEFRKRWIPDTVVALDDLDFSWLHWPNPKRLGDVVLYTNNCWVIRFKNPDASAEIRSKRVWILKERRKILKIGSYDEAGRELQSLTVRKMQRSEMNHWVFSEVNLMKWDPKTQKETGSVFEFESAEK